MKQRVLDIMLWLPTVFLVWVFLRQGFAKFDDASGWANAFAMWHFPNWFRMLVGAAEVSAAILLLPRRTASLGGAIIVIVMIGAMLTHVYWHRPKAVTSEIVPLILATTVTIGRRRYLPHATLRVAEHHAG